jgi:hypothetical protein
MDQMGCRSASLTASNRSVVDHEDLATGSRQEEGGSQAADAGPDHRYVRGGIPLQGIQIRRVK